MSSIPPYYWPEEILFDALEKARYNITFGGLYEIDKN